jgi:serine/threonine protein kinase
MSMIGKTLGTFTLETLIGKGGMGEVYKAKDQKLGRDVAIKVLPEEFAKDADRVARFQREAKLLASLNHPNIAAIHGLEESDGTHFLVLELIEGDTLADRIKRGPIPVEESLKLALQIAEALEAAHEKGVIHRDLKPANVKVTPDGKVKVLDFGLAKAFAGDSENVNLSNSPTLSEAATLQGVILGTAAYMSPEQARGKPVDKRTDIWAFGVVLYEMITGHSAFQGEDVSVTLASVIKGDTNLNLLPPSIHPRVREVITRCLQNDIRKRYSGIADARYEIEHALSDPSGLFVKAATEAKPKRKLRLGLPWIAVITALGIIIAGLAVWYLKPTEPRQVTRSEYYMPEDQQLGNVAYPNLAVSPDGKQFVYATTEGLYLRSIDEFDAKLIIGTETSPSNPFFSPDGKWIGYFSTSDSKLKKISINGGAPVTICDANLLIGASWGADDRIVFAEYGKDIKSVSSNGGIPDVITQGEGFYHPQLLPDGKSLLFTFGTPPYKIIVQSLQSGERTELFAGDNARYIPTGHIIYALENNLFAVPFNLKTLKTTGGQVSVVEGIWRSATYYTPQYAVSDSGRLVYIQGKTGDAAPDQRTLVWVDRKGKEEPIAANPDNYSFPSISPDGTKVALSVETSGNEGIWICDLVHKNRTRLTFNEVIDLLPLWAQDGERIAFMSTTRDGKSAIYWKAANGTGTDELLVAGSSIVTVARSWSKDGKTLIFMEISEGTNVDISAISMGGDHAKKQLLHDKHMEVDPRISPDGRWMAYSCNESGQLEVYVRPFPDVDGGTWQVSTDGGVWPLWSPDGRELFYRNEDKYMEVPVKTEPTFSFETPKVLFQGTYDIQPSLPMVGNWDINPDGKRFLMIKPPTVAGTGSTSVGPRKINIVLNWFEELKERVPTD